MKKWSSRKMFEAFVWNGTKTIGLSQFQGVYLFVTSQPEFHRYVFINGNRQSVDSSLYVTFMVIVTQVMQS
jgi:hypothetical protein